MAGQNATKKLGLPGDPATLYADTDRVIADRSASYDNERLENIRNGFDQGHYLLPIDVRWIMGYLRSLMETHRLKVASRNGNGEYPLSFNKLIRTSEGFCRNLL